MNLAGIAARGRALLPSRADYREVPRSWRTDLVAGLTVGIVALPLALGFGVSSGVGAEAGLVTAIVAGVLAAVFGGSPTQVSGPTGAMVVVLVPIVAMHGVGAVGTVTLMAGILVMLAGLLRLGRAVALIPWPVIEGFTLGIAVIIFLQQVPALTRTDPADAAHHSANAAVAAAEAIAHADPGYVPWALGAVAMVTALMVALPRLHRAIPASLVAIVAVAVVAPLLHAPLRTIGALPASLPAPSLPNIAEAPSLFAPAATVAALAAIESLLSARVAAGLGRGGTFDPDRELFGQGIASIGASVFGGMPATGAIARTAVNARSGARTRLAAITHAVVLLRVVLLVPGPVGAIPLAALSGVLMVTAVRMVHPATVRAIVRSSRADAAAFALTAIVTVSFDLIVAVGLGIAVAAFFALQALARQAGAHFEALPGAPEPGDERIALVRLTGALIFASADRVLESVRTLGVGPDGAPVEVVIVRMSHLEALDATGARLIADIVRELEARGITVLVKGVRASDDAVLRSVGALDALRHEDHLFTSLDDAIVHARSHIRRGPHPGIEGAPRGA